MIVDPQVSDELPAPTRRRRRVVVGLVAVLGLSAVVSAFWWAPVVLAFGDSSTTLRQTDQSSIASTTAEQISALEGVSTASMQVRHAPRDGDSASLDMMLDAGRSPEQVTETLVVARDAIAATELDGVWTTLTLQVPGAPGTFQLTLSESSDSEIADFVGQWMAGKTPGDSRWSVES